MDYDIDTKKGKLSTKSILLLLASIVILPFCLLVAFADHSSKLNPILAFYSIDGTKPGCVAGHNIVTHNQCMSWQEPQTIWPLAVLLLLVIAAFSIGLNFYASRLSHKDGKRFANYRFVITLLVSIIGFIAFAIMRDASQNHASYNFGFVAANLAPGGSLLNGGPYIPISHARFGYGITPAMAILLIAGFILPAFISWHRFIFSRRHIDGQRTKKLFQ
jgi:hypothetical protein